jgi:hypothetical protein
LVNLAASMTRFFKASTVISGKDRSSSNMVKPPALPILV